MDKILNSDDKLIFPENLVYRKKENNLLIISPLTANWIVIKNENLRFFKAFFEKTIGEVFEIFNKNYEEVTKVLQAIIATDFAGINEPIKPIDLHEFDDLFILLTNRCNLRCKHCFMFSGEIKESEMSTEDWKKVILQFSENGGKVINFSGGEAYLYEGLLDLLKYANSLGLFVKLFSNGTLWTDKSIDEVSKYIHYIQISLDGYDEYTNSKIRGTGHFEKTINTIIKFLKKPIRVNVATTFDPEILNQTTKYKYANLVKNLKQEAQKNISFGLTKRYIKGREINYSEEENDIFEQKIRDLEKFTNSENTKTSIIRNIKKNGIVKNCGMGGITLKPNGDVYYCSRVNEIKSFGNIKDKPFLYFKEKGIELCEKYSVKNIEECSKCHLRHICGGGCRLDNFKKVNGKLILTNCNAKKRENLENQLVEAFLEYYDF